MNIGNVSNNSNVQKIGNVAYSIAKEAAKFSKKVTDEIAEKSREYTQSNQLYSKSYVDIDAMKQLLDSKYETEKVEGLRRAIGFIAKGRDCSSLFPSVVKNVAVPSMEIKRLVYDYLIYYANKEQELALLAVNTIQKELSDKNPEVRALAIKVMSSIRIPAIMPIVLQGIKQSIKDDSVLVRQAAINSIIKCYQMNPENKPTYVDFIELALKDTSSYVLGYVVNAFNKICPERLDLIHPHFRRLCFMLLDVDSWGLLAILDLLLSYARSQFESPFKNDNDNDSNSNDNEQENLDSFYRDNDTNFYKGEKDIDSDLRLLLDFTKPILQSYNIAVILKIVILY
jgi:AP-3 complex subunit beta